MPETPQTLLIAESGSDVAATLGPWMAERGYDVKAVNSIQDALITLQNEKVHVLVMDVSLTQDIGHECISIIKGVCRHLPIIVTTEENNPQLESKIRKKGIFYYHVKSFGTDELMLAISNALTRSL